MINKRLRQTGLTYFPIEKIMEKMPAKETIRIAYIPIVICNAALHYTKQVADYCATHRLPYKQECRIIREESQAYLRETLNTIDKKTYDQLEQQTKDFLYSTERNFITLYWTVRNELLSTFPDTDSNLHDIYTNIFIAHSLFLYVRNFQFESEKRMSKVCRCTIRTNPDIHIMKIWKALTEINKTHTLRTTPIIETALQAISNRIDGHIFSDVELMEDQI